MYLGVDVGGSKTLVASFTNEGKISESRQFKTSKNYDHFLLELRHALAHFKQNDWHAAGVGIAVSLFDRNKEIARVFGNLPWKNIPVQRDMERLLSCPVVVENDAKLACVSESHILKDNGRILYVTISTGIGYALVVDGQLDRNIGDGGGRTILIPHRGKLTPWESFASGKAIVKRYDKKAEEIHEPAIWAQIVRDLRLGLLEIIAVTQPDTIVFGGSVGNYFERYDTLLSAELKKHETPSMPMPVLKKAVHPTEAVVLGCYLLAALHYPYNAATH